MLTIFNLINYLIGSPVNITILITITIALYYYLISSFWNTISNNIFYIIILIMLMLIDLTTIYLIFCSPHECDYIKTNKTNKNKKTNKTKTNKTNKNLVLKNKLEEPNKEEPNKEKILINNDNIEIYNDNKSVSLHTY
jgi:uncharacterized protein YpmS